MLGLEENNNRGARVWVQKWGIGSASQSQSPVRDTLPDDRAAKDGAGDKATLWEYWLHSEGDGVEAKQQRPVDVPDIIFMPDWQLIRDGSAAGPRAVGRQEVEAVIHPVEAEEAVVSGQQSSRILLILVSLI